MRIELAERAGELATEGGKKWERPKEKRNSRGQTEDGFDPARLAARKKPMHARDACDSIGPGVRVVFGGVIRDLDELGFGREGR